MVRAALLVALSFPALLCGCANEIDLAAPPVWSVSVDWSNDDPTVDQTKCDRFAADAYRLRLLRHDETVATLELCSTYFMTASVMTDASGEPFVLGRVNEVRGTNAREEYLYIWLWDGVALNEVQRIHFETPISPGYRSFLTTAVRARREGGLIFEFYRDPEPAVEDDWKSDVGPLVPRRMIVEVSYGKN